MENEVAFETQYIVFGLAKEEYAIEIENVQEIIKMAPVTRVPHTPFSVKGVVNLRGNIVPVIDLREKMGLPAAAFDERTRIIVVARNEISVGFIVDQVSEVLRLKGSDIENPSDRFGSGAGHSITGIGKHDGRLIIMLDIDALMQLA